MEPILVIFEDRKEKEIVWTKLRDNLKTKTKRKIIGFIYDFIQDTPYTSASKNLSFESFHGIYQNFRMQKIGLTFMIG